MDLNPMIRSAYQGLYECYLHTNQPEKALEYLERSHRMERHLLNQERLRTMDELEIQYETAKTEKELALAENENLLQDRQLARQRGLILLLALGLALLLALVLLFRQRQKVAQLTADRERVAHQQAVEHLHAEKEFAALQALFAGQEQERRRVANDLHDSLGGLLYALRLRLPDSVPDKVRQLAEAAMTENRRISQDLLPPALARIGLVAALREWRPQFEQNFGLPAKFDLPEQELPLPDETAVSLFRIAQELTTNAAKHAQATQVSLRLTAAAGKVLLLVQDDGIGFDPAQLSESALKTVRSRVRLISGRLEVESAPGKGAAVGVVVAAG